MLRQVYGFTYIIVMFVVAVASIAATKAMEVAAAGARQVREAELLYVGGLYRSAIQSYHDKSPGVVANYPKELSALLEDDRTSSLRRHLRKMFRDPMTEEMKWGVITDGEQIIGVYSLAPGRPQKRGGFSPENADFTNAQSYQDWKFIHKPHSGEG